MIPMAHIVGWREIAPWENDIQVEQDLILSRVIVELFSGKTTPFAFRGGTAFHKLYMTKPARYSEDIDLVQIEAGPIGPILDLVREKLDPLLGKPARELSKGTAVLLYKFTPEARTDRTARIKIEINTREHFCLHGFTDVPFTVGNPWFSGSSNVTTFVVEELMGTKMRALYQRKKGRDLFDLYLALTRFSGISETKIVDVFLEYMSRESATVSRAQYEKNLKEKEKSTFFSNDIYPLLADHERNYSVHEAFSIVGDRLVAKLPGDPWKGT